MVKVADTQKVGLSDVKAQGKKEQVEAMFDDIAPKYDLLNRVLSLGVDRWYSLDFASTDGGLVSAVATLHAITMAPNAMSIRCIY